MRPSAEKKRRPPVNAGDQGAIEQRSRVRREPAKAKSLLARSAAKPQSDRLLATRTSLSQKSSSYRMLKASDHIYLSRWRRPGSKIAQYTNSQKKEHSATSPFIRSRAIDSWHLTDSDAGKSRSRRTPRE